MPFDQPPALRWLAADENPFSVKVLDCTPVTHTYVSTTGDPAICESYNRLRNSTGEEYQRTELEDAIRIPCNLVYPFQGDGHTGRPVFKAEQMEDKWDMYLYDNQLSFVRSWTGQLVYVSELSFQQDRVVVVSILPQSGVDGSDKHTIRVVDYLIKSHIYKISAPHPFPADLGRDVQALALYSFQLSGRRCQLGTFEETLHIEAVKKQLWGDQSEARRWLGST